MRQSRAPNDVKRLDRRTFLKCPVIARDDRIQDSNLREREFRRTLARSPSVAYSASSLSEGAFVLFALKVRLLFLTSSAFADTKAKPRARRGKKLFCEQCFNFCSLFACVLINGSFEPFIFNEIFFKSIHYF